MQFLQIALILAVAAVARGDDPIVSASAGSVKGSVRQSYSGKTFNAFQNIPFAAPPVDDLRFRPPQDPAGWSGTLDASGDMTIGCAQTNEIKSGTYATINSIGQEDCLYLNVYKSEITPGSTGLPVIFWTYGGALVIGDGRYANYGPELLMEEEIVLVTYNYRLGAFGYLNLGLADAPGNMGFLDQSKALQWVIDNIQAFGGDPTTITIMGESAGSWSTFSHLMSPTNNGMFKRAIMESATTDIAPLFRTQTADEAVQHAMELASVTGCDDSDAPSDVLACLKSVPATTIMRNMYRGHGGVGNIPKATTLMGYIGSIDTNTNSPPYLPMTPGDALRSGTFNKDIDVLLGCVTNEGMYQTAELLFARPMYMLYRRNWDGYGPLLVLGTADPTQDDIDFVNKAADFYFGGMSNFVVDNWQNITDLYTDAQFQYGIWTAAGLLADQVTGKVFQYRYTYNAEHHILNMLGMDGSNYGNCHTDELFNLFRPYAGYITSDTELSAADEKVTLLMVNYWATFAKTGDLSSFSWDAVPDSTSARSYMDIGDEQVMKSDPWLVSRMQFWKDNLPSHWPQ